MSKCHRDSTFDLFHREFSKESERAKVILSAAMLDEALEALLKAYLVPNSDSEDRLFDGANAPLGTFSARVDFCFRLGLISKRLSRDLHLIRRIRNEFAHNVSGCTFDVSAVSNRVTLLRQSFSPLISVEEKSKGHELSTVEAFQEIVGWMIFFLWSAVSEMRSLTESENEWAYKEGFDTEK